MSGIYSVDLGDYIRNDRADDLARVLDKILDHLQRRDDDFDMHFPILFDAVRNESRDVVGLLIRKGASCSVIGDNNQTLPPLIAEARDPLPLYQEIERVVDSTSLMKSLVNDGDECGRSMLWHAVSNFGENHPKFIRYLLERAGADATKLDDDGMNLLHAVSPIGCPREYSEASKNAFVEEYISIIRGFCDHDGIDLNKKSNDNSLQQVTPLMHFFDSDNDPILPDGYCLLPTKNKITALFIEKGVDLKLTNDVHENALMVLVKDHYHQDYKRDDEDYQEYFQIHDKEYFQTIKTLLGHEGREQLHGTDSIDVRGYAATHCMAKTLIAFWESEVYAEVPGTRSHAQLFLSVSKGYTLLHVLCEFISCDRRDPWDKKDE